MAKTSWKAVEVREVLALKGGLSSAWVVPKTEAYCGREVFWVSTKQKWLFRPCFGVAVPDRAQTNAIAALADEIRGSLPKLRLAAEGEGSEDDAPRAAAAPASPPPTAAARKLGVGLSDAPSPEPRAPAVQPRGQRVQRLRSCWHRQRLGWLRGRPARPR
eukprot:3253882-Alexandrium_andersonii.AAC.1